MKINKAKPLIKTEWGNPFEECQSKYQALAIGKKMKNMDFDVHVYKLSEMSL